MVKLTVKSILLSSSPSAPYGTLLVNNCYRQSCRKSSLFFFVLKRFIRAKFLEGSRNYLKRFLFDKRRSPSFSLRFFMKYAQT